MPKLPRKAYDWALHFASSSSRAFAQQGGGCRATFFNYRQTQQWDGAGIPCLTRKEGIAGK